MCYACYKSHLFTIKRLQSLVSSTDSDLSTIINKIREDTPAVIDIHTIDQAIHYASNLSAIHVGEALLKQTAMLLPDINNFFLNELNKTIKMRGITIKEDFGNIAGVKWLRSQLSSLLQHHMAYKCTVKRYGTVLYRHNGDLVHALNVSLGQVRTQTNTGTDCKSDTEDNFDSNLTQTCLTLNAKCHAYIRTLLRELRCSYSSQYRRCRH